MEDGAVEDQINRMVQFIKQEAEEKAKEIVSAADEVWEQDENSRVCVCVREGGEKRGGAGGNEKVE